METKSKGSYVVLLDMVKRPLKHITQVKAKGPGLFELSVIHPNSKEVLVSKEMKTKSLDEAMVAVKELLKDPSVLSAEKTKHQEILFIPKPRKGKMKLNTQEAAPEPKKNIKKAKKTPVIKKPKKKVAKKVSKTKKK